MPKSETTKRTKGPKATKKVRLGSDTQRHTRSTTLLALRNVTVIDATGAPPRLEMTVVIAGSRIQSLGATSSACQVFGCMKSSSNWSRPD